MEASYKGKWFRWQAFAASRGMDAVPVTLVGTLLWLRQDLCYTVRMKNVQPYLSALNKCHEHLGLAAVAVGDDMVSTRKAIAAQQAAVFEESTRIQQMTAPIMFVESHRASSGVSNARVADSTTQVNDEAVSCRRCLQMLSFRDPGCVLCAMQHFGA